MRQISIRELRQHASTWLRQVAGGEALEVTDRGRPVAMLVPRSSVSLFERLAEAGRLTGADGDLLELGPPLPPRAGQLLPSEALEQDRSHER